MLGGAAAVTAAAGPVPDALKGFYARGAHMCAHFCRKFGAPGPFWGRSYLFFHDGKPLTLIYEVFSNALGEFLGPPFLPGSGGPPGAAGRRG